MAHVAKFTRGTSGLLTRHYERYKDSEHPEYVKYKNQDIDPERTHLNYNLALIIIYIWGLGIGDWGLAAAISERTT